MGSNGLAQLGLVLGPQTARVPAPLPPMPVRVRPNRVALAPAKKAKQEDRSFWQNVLSLFTEGARASANLGPGLVHLGGLVLKQGTAPVRLAWNVGKLAADAVDGNISNDSIKLIKKYRDDPAKFAADYAPVGDAVVRSMANTGYRLIHPTQYVKKFNEGKLTPALLEDVGNALLVAGPAVKALGASATSARAAADAAVASGAADAAELAAKAARLEKAASVAMRAERLGGQVANAPFAPYGFGTSVLRKAGQLGRDGLLASFEKLAAKDGALGETARNIRATNASRLTTEGRTGYQLLRAGWAKGQRAYDRVWKIAAENAQRGGYNTAEEGAAFALVNGVGKGDYQLTQIGRRLGMTPEMVRELHAQRLLPEQGFTPEIRDLVHAYENGSLPADVKARIESHVAEIRKVAEEVQNTTLAGTGRVAGSLDPQQLGVDAIDKNVEINLNQLGMSAKDIRAVVALKQQAGSWDQLAGLDPLLDQALADITSYPSRWRPLMRQMNLAREAGLPVSSLPRDLAAVGYDPIYLPGGESQLFKARWQKNPQDTLNVGSTGLRGMGSERLRASAEVQPYSWRTYAEQLSGRARTTVLNDALMTFVQSGGIKQVADILDATELSQLRRDAITEATAQNPALFNQPQSPQVLMEQAGKVQEILGARIVDELANKGYEVFQGDKVSPKAGDFNPGAAVDTTKVFKDSMVLPIGVRARFQLRTIPKGVNAVLEGLRYTNRKFKGAVLPFSLRWQMGDALGGFFQGAVGGGILPDEMIAKMADLKNNVLSQDALDATVNHPNFVDTGLTRDMADYRRAAQSNGPRTAIGRLQQKSFALNETINRLNRQAYLLAKLERLLKEKGLSIDSVEQAKAWSDPEVQKAINAAVDDSNKVMGTFDDLTPFEQRYLREISPFYAWTRHITKLAFRTAIDNPVRVLWTLRLGTLVADPNNNNLDWLAGSLKLNDSVVPDFIAKGDVLLPTNFLNPFNDALNNPAFTPSGIARSLSPGLKIPMAGIFGLEANPGDNATPFRMITRPYGETRNPLRDAIYTGLQSFPVTREAINLAPQMDVAGIDLGPVVRYHSGRRMLDSSGRPLGPYANMNPILARATVPLRLAGIPLPTSLSDAQAITKSRTKAATVRRRKRRKVKLG